MNLLEMKKEILTRFEQNWNLHVKSIIPQEAIDNQLTIGSLVRDFGGDINRYLESLKPAVSKRGRKKAAPKQPKIVKKATVSKSEDRAEPLVRRSRRITLKGLGVGEDVELSLYTSNNNYDQGEVDQNESIELENLDKEELLKMRDALRLAEQKASRLLANLGH